MSENKKLFVGGIPFAATEESITEFFEEAGTVDSVKIITDRETGRSRGFGFVEMASEEDAQKAINALNETEMEGRKIVVNQAKEKPRNENRRY
eukprot:COSAG01_NODE_1222_length_11150_cov_2.405755_2_plen_93_part_00